MIKWLAQMFGLGLMILAGLAIAANASKRDVVATEVEASELTPAAAQACEPPRIVLVKPGVTPPNATYHSSSMPPERFRGDNQATIFFTSPAEVERICGNGAKPICKMRRIACVKGGRIIMPNPCGFGTESFGRYSCHELAHVNGWPATHGD